MLPFKSLDAVTATGPGEAWDVEGACNEFTLQHSTTGSPSGVQVRLEGSLDGQLWSQLGSSTGSGSNGLISTGDNPISDGGGSLSFAPWVRYVRANLVTFSGGTSPTLTAWIAAGKIQK